MTSWHESKLRVRFEETDTMGVVYYSKFLVWMEVGRINLMRDIGLAYGGEFLNKGRHIPVVQAHADYKAFARFDNKILVKTRVASVDRRSVRFENEIIVQRNPNATYVDLLLYDVGDLSSLGLTQNMSIQGSYVAARLAQG